ncbi:MAG: phage holin family protein [Alphaproteobacteria bacterium]|nr:phage holin family protein [Alphaproteobacteria bacterium]
MASPDTPDARPTPGDLARVGREVMPRPPRLPRGLGRQLLAWAGRLAVVAAAFLVATVALPGARFLGAGHPPAVDVVTACLLVGSAGAVQAPIWRALVGPVAGLGFGATAWVVDAALLRIVDVWLAARFEIDGGLTLALASALVAVPTAVQAVVADVLAAPDTVSMPP